MADSSITERIETLTRLTRNLAGLALILLLAGFTFGTWLATLSHRLQGVADSMIHHEHPDIAQEIERIKEAQQRMAVNQMIIRLMLERLGQKTGTEFDDLTNGWVNVSPEISGRR